MTDHWELLKDIARLNNALADQAQQHEQDIQGHGALNRRLFSDLRKLAADLETARADLHATRRLNDRQAEEIDTLYGQITGLQEQLKAATGPQEVVLTGWHGMTMTTDHYGNTVLRRQP